MKFNEWFDKEYPITATTNTSLRWAQKELMQIAWFASKDDSKIVHAALVEALKVITYVSKEFSADSDARKIGDIATDALEVLK